jgi:hypothetical protein
MLAIAVPRLPSTMASTPSEWIPPARRASKVRALFSTKGRARAALGVRGVVLVLLPGTEGNQFRSKENAEIDRCSTKKRV